MHESPEKTGRDNIFTLNFATGLLEWMGDLSPNQEMRERAHQAAQTSKADLMAKKAALEELSRPMNPVVVLDIKK